jgi:membrane protein
MKPPDPLRQRIWDYVSIAPLSSLWDLQGVSPVVIAKRTFRSFNEDNLLSRAAELGYYFLFALFPTLVSASAILGLAARSASEIYLRLLNYLALVVPHAAMAVTVLLSLIVTLTLATMLGGDFVARHVVRHAARPWMGMVAAGIVRGATWTTALGLLILLFAVIYYFAPDVKSKRWHWLTPGGAFGIGGWFLASLLLRLYLHYFNDYSATYGSLGAVIILLTWFYVTGLMLLTGAEINSEIAAAVLEKTLTGKTPEPRGKVAPAALVDAPEAGAGGKVWRPL